MAGQDTPRMPDSPDGDGRRGTPPDAAPGSQAVIRTDLRQNSLGLVGVTMQAITHIAPAIAALFFTQFIVSLAGITAPLAYAVLTPFQPLCTTTCPASPNNWAPVVNGAWLVLGLLVLVYYRSQGRDDWLRNAGAALGESEQEYEKIVGGPT